MAERNRVIAAREQAERAARAAEEEAREQQARARRAAAMLAEQQQLFGPWLQEPLLPGLIMDFKRHAPVLRTVSRYLQRYWPAAIRRVPEWKGETLIARRCWKRQQVILCLDGADFAPMFKSFYPMVQYYEPDETRRGYLISKCLACGARQKRREMREGGHVMLRDDLLQRWIMAFRGLNQAATPPGQQGRRMARETPSRE